MDVFDFISRLFFCLTSLSARRFSTVLSKGTSSFTNHKSRKEKKNEREKKAKKEKKLEKKNGNKMENKQNDL